jgi:hypothetical protein
MFHYLSVVGVRLSRSEWLNESTFLYSGCCFVRSQSARGRGAGLIPLFQLLSGIAVIGDALFIHDPLHLVCDLIAFNSSLVVLFLFAWRFWNDIHWKGWSVYSIATALLMMAFLTAFGFANHVGGPAGAMEKLATATRILWSALLTVKLLAGARLDAFA